MSGYGDRYRDPLDEAVSESETPHEVAGNPSLGREPAYLAGLNKEQREADGLHCHDGRG